MPQVQRAHVAYRLASRSAATSFALRSPRLAHFPGRVGVPVAGPTRGEISGSMAAGGRIQPASMATAASTTPGDKLRTRPQANPAPRHGSKAPTAGLPTALITRGFSPYRTTAVTARD